RARDLFVVSQVALSLVLLVSGGLLLRALARAHDVFPGERPEEVVTVTLDPHLLGYDEARTREFYRRLVEGARGLAGVESAALADGVPVGEGYAMTAFEFKGESRMAGVNTVSPGYFGTMKIPLVRGRDFTAADRQGAPPVAVVDEALARRFFAGEDAVGQFIKFDAGAGAGVRTIEVVGVVRSAADESLGWRPHFFVYLPSEQPLFGEGSVRRMILHARAPRPLRAETLDALRREVAAIDPNLPVLSADSLDERMDVALLPQRVAASVATAFGVVGLVLAALGIYGVVSYSVAQRTHEIGVRMALGARRGDVLALVLRRGLRLAAYGIALGLVGAFAATRLLGEMLYGLSATDPATFAGVSLALAAVALAASYVPARRATKVDPMVALRYE
ncbi:MAG TPA: FtsX-like permease family protein, partial [Pyrinomonadaceae bacterium]|nr:FtsX-like permease family protein [Pyrinomonadaceae bacterium]